MTNQASVVGAGLAGLVATCELLDAGARVILVDQENANNLGGQAFWSFGGIFLVDTPQQRRMGVKDSLELAWQGDVTDRTTALVLSRLGSPRR